MIGPGWGLRSDGYGRRDKWNQCMREKYEYEAGISYENMRCNET
jgi:hypothetical protein